MRRYLLLTLAIWTVAPSWVAAEESCACDQTAVGQAPKSADNTQASPTPLAPDVSDDDARDDDFLLPAYADVAPLAQYSTFDFVLASVQPTCWHPSALLRPPACR